LGVALKRSRTASQTLPLELPRLWAALYKTGAALSPAVPVPLAAQLQLTTADVLAGVLYPAAVHGLDHTGTDRFVANLVRRLAGCAKGSSATFLQCETGTVPSKLVAHRRVVQYWLHVSHDSWFAPLLSDFRGQGSTKRLQNTAALYGFTRTAQLSGGRTYPTSKEVWHKRVRDAVADAAARFLQTKAVERKLPGPAVVAKRNNLLNVGGPALRTSPSTGSLSGSAQSQAASATGVRGVARSPRPPLRQARPLCRPVPPARV
jgi:hypothetical protein